MNHSLTLTNDAPGLARESRYMYLLSDFSFSCTYTNSRVFFPETLETCGKIVFKKPVKRSCQSELNVCSNKKNKNSSGKNLERTATAVNNKKLLSFDDDQEDD